MLLDYRNTQAGFKAELKRLARVRKDLVSSLARVDEQIKALSAAAEAFSRVVRAAPDAEVPPGEISRHGHEFKITANIREILRSAKERLTAPEIRDALVSRGWKAETYPNPLAVVHTVLSRLVKVRDAEVEFGSYAKVYWGGYTAAERVAQEKQFHAGIETEWAAKEARKAERAQIHGILPDACLEVLRAYGKPMSVQRIYRALTKKGIDFSSYDSPILAIHSALRRLPVTAAKVEDTNVTGAFRRFRRFYELTDGGEKGNVEERRESAK